MTVVVVGIYAKGSDKVLAASDQLVAVEVRREVNRIPEAKLTFSDGDIPGQSFPLSADAAFAPGAELVIGARYEGHEEAQLFAGVVVRHRIVARDDDTTLELELRDVAIELTSPRKSAIYRGETDTKILTDIIAKAAKVKTGDKLPDTVIEHAELVRYEVSDWDFLLMRADVLGLLVRLVDGELVAVKTNTAPEDATEHSVNIGIDEVFEFELELDGAPQRSEIAARAWDPKKNKPTDVVKGKAIDVDIGAPKAEAIAGKTGLASAALETMVPLAKGELQAWADSRMARSRISLVRGRLEKPGYGTPKPLDTIAISGVGTTFEGTALVGAVVHKIDLDGWRTEFHLGLPNKWFAREPELVDVPAGGLLPPVSGLQIGLVAAFAEDKDRGEHRVQVTLPNFDSTYGAIWARVAWPDAGNERGFVSWPMVGDEVVVGFLNDDPRQAVVLGSLYGSVNAPPKIVGPPTKDNFRKAFVSAKGVTIAVDDERPAVFIQTEDSKNKIEIDAKAKTIVVVDEHENSITMNKDGVSITTKGALTVTAAKDVTIKGASVDLAPA